MTDNIDLASDQEEFLREMALRNQRMACSPRPSATYCEDCGQPIPEQRRQLVKGCMTCVDCQEIREARP